MAKQLNVDLSFQADTSKAKAQIADLQKSLDQLISSTIKNNNQLGIDKEIKQAIDDATKLKVALQAATDADTGKLNLAKFSESLKNGQISLQQYAQHLKALGPEGEQSFLKLSKAIVSAETPMRQTNTLLNQMFVTLKNTAKWQISSSILHGLQSGLAGAFSYAKELDQSLNNIRIVTGYSSDEMARFAEQANKAAQALSTTTTSYTDAALIYYQQGIRDQEEIAGRTETTIKLANVSRQSAEEVSSQMTAIWNNFDNGSKSLEYYADVITALGANTAASSEEIANGMSKFAAVANTVGLSYEYAASSLATIVATTRQSEDTVGTGLRTIFSRLEGLKLGETLEDGVDLNKYSAALKTIGVDILDATGQLKQMDDILDETAQHWDNLDRAQKVAFATTVGGVRQYTNLIALLDHWDMMQENINIAQNSEGTLQQQADIYAESWEAAEKRVRAAAQQIYKDLIDEKFFIKLGDFFTTALNGVDNFINAIGGIPGVIAGVGVILTTVFGKQLSESINSAMYEFSRFTGKAEDIANLQRQDAIKAINDYYSTGDNNFSLSASFLKQEVYDSYELQKITASLTDQQKAYAQEVLKTAEQYHQVAIESEKVYNNTSKQLSNARGSLANDLGNKALPDGKINDIKARGAEEVKTLEIKIKKLISELANAEPSLQDSDTSNAYLRYVENLEKIKIAKEEILQETQKLEEAENKENVSTEKLEAAKRKLAEAEEAAKIAKAEMHSSYQLEQQDIEAIADFILKDSNYKDLNRNKLIALIQATTDHTKSLEDNIRTITNAIEKDEELRKELGNLKTGFQDIGTGAVGTLKGVSQLAMGITSIKGAMDALNNTELTFFEKFSRVSMGLSIGISQFAAGLPVLKDGIVALGGGLASVIPGLSGTGAAATIAAGGLSGVALAAGIVIGVIGVLALTIWGLKTAWENFTPEGQLAKATKEAEKAKKSYDEATNAVNEFKSTYDDWSGLYAKTKELTEGTQEYIEAMGEANQRAMELIQKYNLIQGTDWDFDDKGNIEINYDNYAKQLRLEQDREYIKSLGANTKQNNVDLNNKINSTAASMYKIDADDSMNQVLSSETVEELATKYAQNEITQAELSNLIANEVQKFNKEHPDAYSYTYDQEAKKLIQNKGVSEQEQNNLISSIMSLSETIKNTNSLNNNNTRQAELTQARINLNEKGWYEFGMDSYLNKYYKKDALLDENTGEKYSNEYLIAGEYNRINSLMSSISSENIDDKTKEQVSHALLESVLSGDRLDFSGIDTSKWDKELISQFGSFSDEIEIAINEAASHINPEKIAQNFETVNSIIKELGNGNSISAESYAKLTKAQQTYFEDMGDGTYQLIGQAQDFINVIKNSALSDSVDALEKLRQQQATTNRIVDKTGEHGESYLWNKDFQAIGESAEIRASHQIDALSSVGVNTSQWNEKISSGTMTAEDYARLTEEVYNYKEALLALANSGQDFGTGQQTILNNLAAQATSLYELQGYMQTAEGNYEAYSVGLMNLASQYDNCEQELKEYQEALANQDKALIDSTQTALEQAIIIGDASKKYGLNAKTVETQARQLEKAYNMSADSAARLAVANERMNRGVATLNKNWSNWGKTLKSTDHTSQKYAEALNEATEALADLTGTADVASIPVDFLDSSTESGAEHLKLMEQAAQGNEKAINQLGVALGEASVQGMNFNENFAQAAIDSGALDMSLEQAKNSFNTWQGDVLEGITALQNAIVDGTVAAGDNITSLMDGTGQDWVNSLNAMALATGMSVEQMNSLLNQLGVQAKVDVVSVPQEMQVPTYTEYSEATQSHPAEYEELEGGGRVLKTPPSWSRKTWTVPGEPKTVTGYAQVAQISTEEGDVGAPQITYTGTAGSGRGGGVQAPSGKGGGGGGGGGGSSKAAKKKDITKKNDEKEIDRYIKINQELAQKEHESTLLDTKLKSTSGQSAIKVMKEQLSILKQQKGLYNDLAKEAKNYREKDLAKMKEDFAELDFQIDPSDGMLLNYEALLKEQTDLYNKVYNEWTDKIIEAEKEYNAQIEILGEAATEEALKPWLDAIEKLKEESKDPLKEAEERYEKFKKDTDKYNDSVEQARKAEEEAAAKELEAYNQELEIIAKGVELKIKVDDADLQYLEFLLKQIGEGADKALDRMANYTQSIEDNMNKIEKYQDGLAEVLEHAGIDFDELLDGDIDDLGTFNEEDLAKVEEYRDALISCGEQLIELRKTLLNEVGEAFDEFNSDLDRAIDKIEHLKNFTSTYKNLIDIVGKDLLDPTGKATIFLSEKTYEQSKTNTEALKKQLDFQLSAIDDYNRKIAELQADNTRGEHDDTIKEFKNQLKEVEDAYQSTQAEWLSSWEETVQAAADMYEAELDQIIKDFGKSISGLAGSLEDLSQQYERTKDLQDMYVDDYEKIYQLSKLNRDINKSIDDTDNIRSKQRLRDLQQQINDLQNSENEMSEYELENLRRRYELELASLQLEETRDAKSQVRMVRDNEGNWGYVYTADETKVEEAEQNYEDKLYAMQKANTEYIESLEAEIVRIEQEWADALAEIKIQDYASYEEYKAAIDQCNDYYSTKLDQTYDQMDIVLSENKKLYDEDWARYSALTEYKISEDERFIDNFRETNLAQITGYQTIEDAIRDYHKIIGEDIDGSTLKMGDSVDSVNKRMQEAYKKSFEGIKETLESGEIDMEHFTESIKDQFSGPGGLDDQLEDSKTAVGEMADEYDQKFTDIIDYAGDFAMDFDGVIQDIIESCNEAIEAIQRLLEAMAEAADNDFDANGMVEPDDYQWVNLKEGTGEYEWAYQSASTGQRKTGSFEADYTLDDGTKYRASYTSDASGILQASAENSEHNGYFGASNVRKLSDSMDRLSNSMDRMVDDSPGYAIPVSGATGMYTGSWGDKNGKLGILHEKELVLNADDTENILSAIGIIRNIANTIDLNAASTTSMLSGLFSGSTIANRADTLQQQVTITAEFPNATNHSEIEEAFDNLVNKAAQYANRKI